MAAPWFVGLTGVNTTAQLNTLFDYNNYGTYSSTGGFDNGPSLKLIDINANVGKTLPSPGKTKSVGAYIRGLGTHSHSQYNTKYNIFTFLVGTTRIQLANEAGGLAVYSESTLLGSIASYIDSSLHHVEFKLFSDASAGTIEVWVDGTSVLSAGTLNTDGSDITYVYFGVTDTSNVYYGFIFVADDHVGEAKVARLDMTSDTSVAFSPSTGTDNYAMVDDTASDGDSTYNQSDTLNAEDLFGVSSMTTAADLLAYSINVVAKKGDAGIRVLTCRAKQDSTTYSIGDISLATEYPSTPGSAIQLFYDTAPDSSSLTPAIINALDIGYKITT